MLHEAGFPVWLVIALGSFSMVQALRHRHGAPGSEVVGAVAATIFAGLCATLYGMRLSVDGVADGRDPNLLWLVVLGVKESLGNLFVAGALGVAASLVATVGSRRSDVASAD